ncbi:MAG TPA: outer membrane beta-barrel protein [Fontimonas sp.]
MKKTTGGLIAIAALACSAPALASDKFQRVEFFGSYGQFESDYGDDFDGIGGGLRIVGGQRVGLFGDLQAEYIPTEREISGTTTDLDVQNYRAGIGFGLPAFADIGFLQLKAEYVSLRNEVDFFAASAEGPGMRVTQKDNQAGYGVHLQVEQDIAGSFGIDASAGYLDLEDFDGSEFTVGLHWVPDNYGFFTQFRWANLGAKDAGVTDVEFSSLRVGFRVPF